MPTTWYAQSDADFTAGSLWNDVFDGSGSYGTPVSGDTCIASGHNITISTLISGINLDSGGWIITNTAILDSCDMVSLAGNFTQSGDISVIGTSTWAPNTFNQAGFYIVLIGPDPVTLDITNAGAFSGTVLMKRDGDAVSPGGDGLVELVNNGALIG